MRGRTGWWGVVLDAPDAPALASFYSKLFDWPVAKSEPDWSTVAPSTGEPHYLAFQTSPGYVRPVWPPTEGQQQQMLHLDVGVTDVEAAVADAVELGATLAGFQP